MKRHGTASLLLLALALGGCDPDTGGVDGRPRIDPGSDRCIGEGETAILSAFREPGEVLSFHWSVERTPPDASTVGIEHPTFRSTATTPLTVQGRYVFRVVATDAQLRSRASFVTVNVGSPGASGDFCTSLDGPSNIMVGTNGVFTVSAAIEGEFTYLWEELSTNGVSFGTPTEAQTTVAAERAGDAVIRVTVSDSGTGLSGSVVREVTIDPRPMLGVTIDGPDTGVIDDPVELTAVTENAAGELSFAWRVLSGAADLVGDDQATVEVTPTETGPLRLEVEVVDAETEDRATATKTLTIQETFPLDVTIAAADPLVQTGEETTLTAEPAETFDDIAYEWEVVEGPGHFVTADAPEGVFVADGADSIRVSVKVTGTEGSEIHSGTAEFVVVSYEADESNPRPHVLIDVENFGAIRWALEVDAAPKTVANFLQYVDEGFFDGVVFHRVISDFVIQAGGFVPSGDELEQKEATRDPVESEAPNDLSNVRGTVAMALRGQDANSGDTQFFINLGDNSNLDTGPPPFTVFAEVVEGMDVVDEIGAVETGSKSGQTDVPLDNVVITSIARAPPGGS